MSVASFVLSVPPASELRGIHAYIATDDRAAIPMSSTICGMPCSGWRGSGGWAARDDLADETLRVWTVHSYLMIYRPETRPLQIVRVLSGYRDIATLFESPIALTGVSRTDRACRSMPGVGGRAWPRAPRWRATGGARRRAARL